MRGDWEDWLIHEDGTKELVASGQNLIVNSAFIVIAMCMKQDATADGLMYWAVGSGTGTTSTWDAGVAAGSIAAAKTDTALATEIYRKAIAPGDIVFVDGSGNTSASPTNRLKITVTFTETQPNNNATTDLREWGIFGGNASATANSGYLVNRKVHKTYVKTNTAQLQRVLTITF